MKLETLNIIINVLLNLKFTLVGPEGLDNIAQLVTKVKENKVPGAFVEAGVWRGGACIFARALMDHLEIVESVYVCDSFEGLPKPKWLEDKGDNHFKSKELAVSLNTVKENFDYFPLEGKVEFIKGLFKDTMPKLKEEIGAISVLRVDADMYEGTTQVLENLYDKVSEGGYVIADDYALPNARLAVDNFRARRGIVSPIIKVNNTIHYWQK